MVNACQRDVSDILKSSSTFGLQSKAPSESVSRMTLANCVKKRVKVGGQQGYSTGLLISRISSAMRISVKF